MKPFLTAALLVLLAEAAIYSAILFPVFQWRNPKANEMSYFRDATSVLLLRKLDKYQ